MLGGGHASKKSVLKFFSKKSHSAEIEPTPYLYTLSRTIPYLNTLSRTIAYLNTLPILIHCRTVPYPNTLPNYSLPYPNTLPNYSLS